MSVPTRQQQSICWPRLFWLKWVAMFLGALICGGMFAAFTIHRSVPSSPPPPKPTPVETPDPASAQITVFAKFQGQSRREQIAAWLYYIGKKGHQAGDPVIRVGPRNATDHTYPSEFKVMFRVEPMDFTIGDDGKAHYSAAGKPTLWEGNWVKKHNDPLRIDVEFDYPRPKLHYKN